MSAKYKKAIQELASVPRKVLVRFRRPYEAGHSMGYILDAGADFFLMALVDDTIRMDGFLCLRYKDVRKLESPAMFEPFVAAALKHRGERIPEAPSVSLVSVSDLLLTAATHFPLLTIHREKVDSEVCHIGRITGLSNKQVALLEIGPDAIWEEEPNLYSLKDITQAGFGGGYEEALMLVGGEPDSTTSMTPEKQEA